MRTNSQLLTIVLIIFFLALVRQVVPQVNTTSSVSPVSPDEWYALLDFKARIAKFNTSLNALLSAWNVSNVHNVCKSWLGVTCTSSALRHIAAIELAGLGLEGSLSPHVGNLTFLSTLNLSLNHFSGPIPHQLSACSSLRHLDLNFNNLTGPIPPSLASLKSLETLRLSYNRLNGSIPTPLFTNSTSLIIISICNNSLTGSIPGSDWHLPNLEWLLLWENYLTGPIPRSVGECSNLIRLELQLNQLSGTIPSELGYLAHLQTANLWGNNLVGNIPHSLGNCSNLETLFLDANQLSGTIPSELGNLAHLQDAFLWGNKLVGNIPHSLGNCSNLEALLLDNNQLSGTIPSELGYLAHLQIVYLSDNKLVGNIPPALGNCTQLTDLALSGNQLSGFIPPDIMKLNLLQTLFLDHNQLVGPLIIASFANMTSLMELVLASNLIGGSIPASFGQLQGLQGLSLDDNRFSGRIPWDFLCNCTSLYFLGLSYNHLIGSLSSQIGRLSRLQHLYLAHNSLQGPIPDFANPTSYPLHVDLSFNKLNGTLPDSLANVLKNVLSLNFSHNFFSGEIPHWLEGSIMVSDLDLSHNHFGGPISERLGNCKQLARLNLSFNNLTGEIPSELGAMLSLISLDLSENHLTGMLPASLGKSQTLSFINVSFNSLDGPIPDFGVFKHLNASSFQGNLGLCGPVIHKPCVRSHHHAQFITWKSLSILIALLIIIIASIACCFVHKYQQLKSHRAHVGAQGFKLGLGKTRHFSAMELSESTQGYSEVNVLGEGALSVVYKGVLPDGEIIAIKKFRDLTCAHGTFLRELQIMSKIRHRNLIRVLGYVLNLEERALVLEFMPSGSLERYLHECKTSNRLISLSMIIKISQGVANALKYLHQEYDTTSIIHGDVKPSNILLDSEFEAHLADFGLAKLLKKNMGAISISSNIEGSIGYMAPEFAYAAKITPKVDIYSFGVVLLEMITGMGPTHELLHGVTLHEWVKHKLLLPHDSVNLREIMQPSLLVHTSASEFDESRVWILLKMATACSEIVPNKRPAIGDVKSFLDSQQEP